MANESRAPWGLFALIGGVVAATGAALAFTPVTDPDLSARPNPATDYADALARIDAVFDQELGLPLSATGGSIAMLHGHKTERAVVLFHGYTVTPAQFGVIAKAYYDAGANVWVPRMPYHGFADRMTDAQSLITPQVLRDHADASIDIALGLGDRVEIAGLSGGGSLTLWAAVARPEVHRAVMISPLVKPLGVPVWTLQPLSRVFRVGPDRYQWWEPEVKEGLSGDGYPRFSFKGIAAFLALVEWAYQRGKDHSRAFPRDGRLVLVANDGDQRLDTDYNRIVAYDLASPRPSIVVDIPADDRLPHDIVMIDGESAQRIDLAYAYLEMALGVELPIPSELDR